tara:strand:- start:186 stop:344 length:159 start_codon:yes stop_codon:yes gene_type:complete
MYIQGVPKWARYVIAGVCAVLGLWVLSFAGIDGQAIDNFLESIRPTLPDKLP